MKKIACALFSLLFVTSAFAADNAVIVTPGVGVPMKSKDVGAGLQSMQPVLSDTGGNPLSMPTSGADGVSNTATGLLGYTRNLVFNGTTWDRWTGDLTNGGWVNVKASALPTGAATSANQATANASLATIATNTGASVPAGTALIGKVGIDQTTDGTTNGVRQTNAYPSGATPITASATGTTAATTATLAAAVGKTTYICGYSIRANATAAATVTNTITGVITATLSSIMWVAPLASGIGIDEQIFSPCIPASGTNQAIAIVSGAPGSGGTVSSKGWGYQQ